MASSNLVFTSKHSRDRARKAARKMDYISVGGIVGIFIFLLFAGMAYSNSVRLDGSDFCSERIVEQNRMVCVLKDVD